MNLSIQKGFKYVTFEVTVEAISTLLHLLFDATTNKEDKIVDRLLCLFKKDKLPKEIFVDDELLLNDALEKILALLSSDICQSIRIENLHCEDILFINHEGYKLHILYKGFNGKRKIDAKQISGAISRLLNDELSPWLLVEQYFSECFLDIWKRILPNYKDSIRGLSWLSSPSGMTIPSPLVRLDYLKLNIYPIMADGESFILSETFLKMVDYNGIPVDCPIGEVYDGENLSGFTINGFYLSLHDDLFRFVKEEYKVDYVFSVLVDWYGGNDNSQKLSQNSKFIEAAKKPGMNLLLSKLQCNLYLPLNTCIPNIYKKYFEHVVLFSNPKDVDSYSLYVSNRSRGTLLGVYSNEKIDTNYNLLHWYSAGDKVKHYRGERYSSEPHTFVEVLRPEYSFYYLHRYFEDMVATLLKDCQLKFYHNLHFYEENVERFEIDVLLKKTDRIVIVENKTRLSIETIENTLQKKVEVMQRYFDKYFPGIKFDYVLLSQFSNSKIGTIENFIPSTAKQQNEKFAMDSYDFEIPIMKIKDLKLRCIAEPSIKKLKRKIQELCN